MPSVMSKKRRFDVYTDGGADPNPGVGGWGAVVLDLESAERRELSGGEEHSTNNRMEMTAAIEALRALEPGAAVDLHTDSTYLRLGVTRWLARWKREGWRVRGGDPVKNDDLWRALEKAALPHDVRWHWVKGHSGHQHNERAHQLAAAEIATRRRPRGTATASPAPPPAVPAEIEVLLKLSCANGRGVWVARVRRAGEDTLLGGAATDVTANRLELLAAAAILDALPERATVDWRGGSDYLREGATSWLRAWRRRGWRTSSGDPVKNADLWRGLEPSLAARTVRFGPVGEEDREPLRALEREVKQRLARRDTPAD
jgi:ribonuclease HI